MTFVESNSNLVENRLRNVFFLIFAVKLITAESYGRSDLSKYLEAIGW